MANTKTTKAALSKALKAKGKAKAKPASKTKAAAKPKGPARSEVTAQLSAEVVKLIDQGLSAKAVAEKLGVDSTTVQNRYAKGKFGTTPIESDAEVIALLKRGAPIFHVANLSKRPRAEVKALAEANGLGKPKAAPKSDAKAKSKNKSTATKRSAKAAAKNPAKG